MAKFKLYSSTKNELKKAKKEKARCKKIYPDWKDDEYNCGPLKFIWGVKSHDDLTANGVNFYSMNDIDIVYNRDTKMYLLGIETIYLFESHKYRIEYLNNLLDEFREYLYKNNLFEVDINPQHLYLYNNGEMFISDNLTDLYYKFKIFVKGYENL